SRDVYGFKLGYYTHDYTTIGGSGAGAFNIKNYTAPGSLDNTGNPLFNGNISTTTLALSKIISGSTTGYSYGYDQLNRLVEMRQHNTNAAGGWSNSNIITAYRESIAYDANGNILKYLRNGTSATTDMDSLNYKYNRDGDGNLVNNKLNYVKDQVSSSNYSVDIDDQSPNNYGYDLIGNLKKDVSENIDTIRWTVYGKINKIVKNSNAIKINYGYDPGGNRTTKIVSGSADTTTFYVRDAQGNVLAVYTKKGSDDLHWDEQDLYGSSRLGLWRWDTIVPTSPPVVDEDPIYDSLMLGSRTYELTNHLGNVLSTISDKKVGNDSSGVVNYYLAEVLSQNDYFPFGMMMPGRQIEIGVNYRYGFNGKEQDTEGPVQYDYGFRIYDPRIARFKSIDPLGKSFPFYTPYQFAGNKPIAFIDLDGLEDRYYALEFNFSPEGKLQNVSFKEIEEMRAGKHTWGNREWEVPVGRLGKGDATFVNVTYNPNPQTVTTKRILSHFQPREKGFLEKIGDLFSTHKDDDIGEGYYLTGKNGGSGDPFGPGAKKVTNIPNADALISMLGGAGGPDKGMIESIQKGAGWEKVANFFESLSQSLEAGEKIGEAVELAKDKAVPDPNTVYCTSHPGEPSNFLLDSNGHVTYELSNKPAGDTVNGHQDPVKDKSADSNNSTTPTKKIKNK
ncbi:MAG TPA: RHS repeat-associated core domain-containing protein, partial [Chitinophagaceae bacterium]|nr:RHS repeat-associated core domain-containing protein [Chitinophagaceae bacterium]